MTAYLDCSTEGAGGGGAGGGNPAGVEWATVARWGWMVGGCQELPPDGEVRPAGVAWGCESCEGDDDTPNGFATALNLWSDFAEWTVSVTTIVLVPCFL